MSLYSIIEYFVNLGKLQIILKIMISFFVIFTLFRPMKLKEFFKKVLVLYLITWAFGGASFMFMFLINPQKIIFQKGHFVGTYPIKMALIGGLFGFVLVMAIFKVFKRGIINKSSLCEIEIIYKKKNVKMRALIDSR